MTQESHVIGVDVGGTFTDAVVWARSGVAAVGKSLTTHGKLEDGVAASIATAFADLGLTVDEGLGNTELLLHGTTVGTNAIVERTGARVGLLCTRGHADALTVMRASGRVAGLSVEEVLDVSHATKPAPLVPRHLIEEIDERSIKTGAILIPVDDSAVTAAASRLAAQGCEAVAVGFLWSFVTPDNERAAVEAVRAAVPGLYVTASSEIAPRQGEYERLAATVVNAYVGPELESYLTRLGDWLTAHSFPGQLLIMTCSGGVIRTEAAARRALLTIGSGPAAGALATERLAAIRGEAAAIATDMGGTTFDVSIIHNGAPTRRPTSIAQQYEYFAETIDIQSLGAGGGSIASVDSSTRTLQVGPRSAGSVPGPACYGQGGLDATVTDADLFLGYIDPAHFLGGAKHLDFAASERAIGLLADRLDLPVMEVAAGIVRITDERMADLIRRMTIQRGLDPRTLPVYAYGGAAPLHVGAYARALGCTRAIVPLGYLAPAWSAFGAAAADVSHVRLRGRLLTEPLHEGTFWDIADSLRQEVTHELGVDGFGDERSTIGVRVEMRYAAQTHSIDVESPPRGDGWASALVDRFETLYASLYGEGAAYRAAGVEITTIKVYGRGVRDLPSLPGHTADGEIRSRTRPVYWHERGAFEDTPVFEYASLPAGYTATGPCIVELPSTCVVVHPGQSAAVDAVGNIELELAAAALPARDGNTTMAARAR